MTHEKIFKRKDGSRVKVSVWLYVQEKKSAWGYVLSIQEPGSDRWFDPFSHREFRTKTAGSKFPEELEIDSNDHYVSKDEILQTKMELWKMIKPE